MVGRFKLNPLDEDFNMDGATDEDLDIFKAASVMDSKAHMRMRRQTMAIMILTTMHL